MIDIDQHIANLPDPKKDKKPEYVGMTPEEELQAKRDKEFLASLLDTKKDTESRAKTILEGPIFRGKFKKDGDYVTLPGGRQVWQKKISDFVGGVPLVSRPNAHTYVEVKGVSPDRPFAFARLDKRNNPRQASQHEKLTKEMERGNLVWLFIGWWDYNNVAMPVPVKQGSRTVNKWYRHHVELTATLIQWQDWLGIYDEHKYRSIRQKDRPLLDKYSITKVGNRWTLCEGHWWHELV